MRYAAPLLLALAAGTATASDADRARGVLAAHCARCHGEPAQAEGKLADITDLAALVERKLVVPGDPAASRLVTRMEKGTMPPAGESPRPSADDLAAVRRWVAGGAQVEGANRVPASADVSERVLADLGTLERRARRFQRYFTLQPGQEAVQRPALSKLLNSLSWNSVLRAPVAIDAAGDVLRIDLRWYTWDAALWNRLAAEYPYGVADERLSGRWVTVQTGTRLPIVRADWFAATASRPPLYYDLLQMPQSLPELERQLRVDAQADIQQERVRRAGFNGSGVSRFNRLLERHDSAHGMYWRSYDFDEPPANLAERGNGTLAADRRNLFAFPLGPNLVETPFTHAGGEAIFALPNGLHGYMLVKGDNTRIDKAPVNLVSDPRRPDRAVEAGLSCLSCHTRGIHPKADQVRDHAAKHPKAFNRKDAELIRALYPPAAETLEVMEADAARYETVLKRAGVALGQPEPVSSVVGRYEADVGAQQAAQELGLSVAEFRRALAADAGLAQQLGALSAGGTVTRALWVQLFGDAVRSFNRGTLIPGSALGPLTADATGEADPLEDLSGNGYALVFSPDGKRAVAAAADRSVRVREVASGRDLQRLVGHTASVAAVALSPDGTRALSGSADGTARLWNLDRGSELLKLEGHAGTVSAVAFSPDGNALTADSDGTLIGWELPAGRERFRIENLGTAVAAVAPHPRDATAFAAVGRKVAVIDTARGRVLRSWPAGDSPVTVLRILPDGRVLAGSDAGAIRLFDADGNPLSEWRGHTSAVTDLAWTPRGLLSASADRTVRLWSRTDPRAEPTAWRVPSAPLAAAFLPGDRQAVSATRDLRTAYHPLPTAATPTKASGPPDAIPWAK